MRSGHGLIAAAQSACFVVTGLAPFVSRPAFERVTGRRQDGWLVQTTGALIAVVGAGLGLAAARNRVTPEVRMIAVGSAAALTAVEVLHTARRRIRPLYLLDAVVEAGFLAAWSLNAARKRRLT